VFFFGGLDQTIEHEALDRTSIALPEIQLSLLLQVGAAARSPVNVVMMSGSSLDLSYVRDKAEYGSLIWMGYAGQAGGYALGTVVFGQYNPAGRLPITFYPASYTDAVNMTDMQM
jgi:beta-D-xylosidase 4